MEPTHTFPARIFFLILLFVYLVKQARCGHIVGFASLGFVSHNRVLWKLGKELQTRGHKYTQILPNFAKETYDDIDVKIFNSSLTNEQLEDWCLYVTNMGDFYTDMYAVLVLITEIVPKRDWINRQFCEDLLKHESLIAELKGTADLVLCDVFDDCCFILADMLNATRVDVSPEGFAGIVGAYLFGYPQAPVYATLEASISLPSASKFSFTNRLKGFLHSTFFWYGLDQPRLADLWEKNGKANSKFTNAVDARRTHGIALIPHDFALGQSRPVGANIKVIGAISAEPAQRLPEYLDKFMRENKVVVVVSFGTIFSNYPTGLAQTIADELSQVSAAVLWKYSGTIMPKRLGKNIKIIPWFPKNECSFNDILGHSSTKVFVTHGGLNGFQESVYHGVPMVVIPLTVDQPRQANFAQYKKLGVAMKWKSIQANGKVLRNGINEVLNNKVYKENVKRLSIIMKDRKQSPSQQGADWIEYALRHDGASHLTSEAIDLPQYKLHMFDVFIFLVVVACLVIYALLHLCCCIFRACVRNMQVKEKQT